MTDSDRVEAAELRPSLAVGGRIKRRMVLAWSLWDWGSSAYSAVVTSFVFGPYVVRGVVGDAQPGGLSANTWLGISRLQLHPVQPAPRRIAVAGAGTAPGIGANMVVIATGRNERGAGTHFLHHLKAEDAAVEPERAIEIGDLEVDMPDPGAGDDGWVLGHGVSAVDASYLAPLAGRGRTLREAESSGEGVQVYREITIRGESPSPQPSKSELRSSRPREGRGEGA